MGFLGVIDFYRGCIGFGRIYLFFHLSIDLSIYVSMYLSIHWIVQVLWGYIGC